jgi:hypothetical protein
MALITGLPNFFTTTSPAASDFNNAAKAIATQVGGVYYDESQVAIVTSPGNLNTANLNTYVGFKNQQKAEPFSLVSVTALMPSLFTPGTDIPMFGPFGFDWIVTSISFQPLLGDIYPIGGQTGGTFDLYINGAKFGTYHLQSIGGMIGDIGYVRLQIPPIRIGDSLWIDSGNLVYATAARTQGADPAPAAITELVSITVAGKALHVGV